MFCKNCGTELVNETNACPNCGTASEQPVVVQAAPQTVLPEENRPLSGWAYFGLQLLFAVPIVGFVFLIVFSFNGSNINRRNFARSYWCVLLLAVIFAIVFVIIALLLALIGINVGEYVYNY